MDEIPPSSIAFFDQQVAEGSQWLDAYIAAHKVDITNFGGTLATMGLAETLMRLDNHVVVSNLLAIAIGRLAKQ